MIEDRKLSDQRWKQLNVIMNLLMVQRNSVREHEQFVLLSQCVSVVINGLISSMRLL